MKRTRPDMPVPIDGPLSDMFPHPHLKKGCFAVKTQPTLRVYPSWACRARTLRPPRTPALLTMILCLLVLLPAAPARGEGAPSGSCATFDFSRFYADGRLAWSGVARTIRDAAPLFSEADGAQRSGELLFNQQAEIMEEGKKRIKIRSMRFRGKEQAIGWVRKRDMLCRNTPIKGGAGLEMKFFIKTSTTARKSDNREPTVQVFQDPELQHCMGGQSRCREGASRFHMYFVFDQTETALLLGDRYRLEEEDVLLGWVAKGDGFIWNNAFSLRPREDLRAPDGSGIGTLCTYERLEDALTHSQRACQPVEGGNAWFQSPLRIPVLDLVDAQGRHVAPDDLARSPLSKSQHKRRFYKVALARPGLVARRIDEDTVAIAPSLAREIMPEVRSLSAKKQVDIFFVLDATASMEPVIDAVRGTSLQRGVIQEIIHSLKNTQGFRETQFRFGFRIYRDPYAERRMPSGLGDGVGEGLALSNTCTMDAQQQQEALATFQEAISRVQVTNDDADDYEENTYGGLAQALKQDMTACPSHLKLLFVIGDSGYRSAFSVQGQGRGRAKYRHPIPIETLIRQLRGSATPGTKANNIIPFFIRTPSRAEHVKRPDIYTNAYTLFATQARHLLTSSLPLNSDASEHFLQMGEENLVARLMQTIEKLGSSELINEIILDIRGGAALTAVIDRLRRERVDIPGVYWHILKQGACGELGEQCEKRVFDTTKVAYIEADDKVVEELWINSGELSSWIRILRGFEGYFDLPEAQLRRALISAMVLGLQQEIRRPPIDVSGETPAEYAQRRGGLPVRRHSPLLSYHVNALSSEWVERNRDGRLLVMQKDKTPLLDSRGQTIPAVPVCELRRLALWAIKSKELLEIIERDYFKPVFKAKPYQARSCPDATPNGRALIRIDGAIQRTPLGPDKSYHYAHTLGGRRGYWIPQELLP